MTILSREQAKYADIWSLPEYRRASPGERHADLFGRIVKPTAGRTVFDFGCGAGAGGLALEERHGLHPAYLDMVEVEGVPEPFFRQSLWQPIPQRTDYGYCCDVMEHLPEQFTMLAAQNMLDACNSVFFAISFTPDHFGAYVGEDLHLTVKPFTWWRDSLGEIGEVLDARDLIGEGVFHVRS